MLFGYNYINFIVIIGCSHYVVIVHASVLIMPVNRAECVMFKIEWDY